MDYIDPIEPLFTRTLFKKTAYFNHPTCFVFYFFKITFMQINVSEYTSPNVSGNMKSKLLNFLLIVTSLLGYLEWGGDNHIFLFQSRSRNPFKIIYRPTFCLTPFYITATRRTNNFINNIISKKTWYILYILKYSRIRIVICFYVCNWFNHYELQNLAFNISIYFCCRTNDQTSKKIKTRRNK